jgi:hypothetical protein
MICFMMKTIRAKEIEMRKIALALLVSVLTFPVWSQAPVASSKTPQAKPKASTKAPQKSKVQEVARNEPDTVMGPDELAIADRVHKGQLPCELGASVRLEADASQPGYFYLHGKGFRYRMHPVVTTTGAIRLEDRKAGAVWLQLANKSMLMDQNKGRRLADECANAEQIAFAENMKTNPPPSLIDTTGMGR